jgi:general secretion pathway protein K
VATVDFKPENGRVDLNAASKELLVGLFTQLGATPRAAEDHANRVVAWRTTPPKGDHSEADSYQNAGLRYTPRGASFPHINELSLVLGLPPALVERAQAFVTVFSGRPQVNALAAAPQVLAALPGMSPDRLQAFLVERDVSSGNPALLTTLLGPSRSYASFDAGKTSRVMVRINFDNGRRLLSQAVILVSDEGKEPMLVLSQTDAIDESTLGDRPGSSTP